MVLFLQCLVGCLLFSLVLIPAALNPVKYLSMYPIAVQEKVRALPQYSGLPKAKTNRLASIAIQGLAFAVAGVPLCILAGKVSFSAAFIHMLIFFMAINLFDFLVIDCLIFCRFAQFRIAGTEQYDKEYKDYKHHFIVFLRGVLLGVVVSLAVACAVVLIA